MAYCLNPDCPQPQNPPAAKFCGACGSALSLAERYRARSLLGESSFGRTLLAEDLAEDIETSSAVAEPSFCVIKQIYRRELAAAADFSAEAQRLRKLGEHPQIPRLLTAVENELGQFWVQAFVAGENLEEHVEKVGTWGETGVRSLLQSLVPVLQYVHSFDIIHRDLKPANIILKGPSQGAQAGSIELKESHNGSQYLPMLVDFGAAKWVRRAPANTVIGSAGYAAPEQSMGQATFASDIYSLGLICLHLLTGVHPFLLYSTAEDRWVWQDYLPQSVEPRFAQVLDQMVARSLQQRYESLDQLALDLQFSRNPLIHAPKQLLSIAKAAAPSLSTALKSQKTKALPRSVVVSDSQHWQRQHRITQPIGVSQALAISPLAPMFATAGSEGAIRLWHLPSAQLVHTFQRRRLMGNGHTAAVTALQFHPDGRALYSASVDGTIKEWDSAECGLLNTLDTTGWAPTALKVAPNGAQLVSANSNGKIVLWDIATLMPVVQLVQHQKSVTAIAFSARGDVLASASDDGTVKLWQYQPQQNAPQLAKTIGLSTPESRGSRLRQQLFNWQKAGGVGAIALALSSSFSQGQISYQLAVATSTGKVQMYPLDVQLNPGAPIDFYQSPLPITAFALSVDGYLAIGTEDSVLTIWQLSSGNCVAQLAHDWGVVAIAFSADGKTLITTSADEVISVWQKESVL
ncbi:MAG: WD40 repeat domain-containing serine/threonine-protein kinase [Phormidesmis sp.]